MTEVLSFTFKVSLVVFMAGNLLDMGLRLNLQDALVGFRNPRFVIYGIVWSFVLCPALAWLATVVVPLEPPYAMGLLLGSVTLLCIPLSSGLLSPVFRLFEGTKEIAMGNFDYRIPEVRKDELGLLVKSFNRMAAELKKKEILKGVFNRYVSPHLADEILKDPERITLGGDRREVTVMFADIRGFTSIARKLEPEETVELLNRYFTVITEVIFRFEGTVDKFMGDCVMSVFGAPIKSETHLEQGLKAAMAVKKAVEELSRVRSSEGAIGLDMGIGLASGEVIAGNMGSMVRMEYTAVGDTVNLASRLTDLAGGGGPPGIYILICWV